MRCPFAARRSTRRAFVRGASAASLALLAGCGRLPWQGQAPAKRYRIGLLDHFAADPLQDPFWIEFRAGLRELGYVEGENLVLDVRHTDREQEQLNALAAELVALRPDMIVTRPISSTRAARAATTTIPIVNTVSSADLVEAGLAASLARPGGNVTGLSGLNDDLLDKWMELLKAVAPNVSRIAILGANLRQPVSETAARVLGIAIEYLPVRSYSDLDLALNAVISSGADGLAVRATPWTITDRQRIVDLAAARRLPAISGYRQFVDSGGLMSYVTSGDGDAQRVAVYVDKLLKGADPAQLPLERPTRFSLVVNLKTAKALGLDIPYHVLLQATEMVE